MENLSLGLSTAVIGLLVVFFGLVILIFCIKLLTKIMARPEKKTPVSKETVAVEPAADAAPAVEEDDTELVAVISAAIAAVWDKKDTGFVVRRIRRAANRF